jgi:peptidoglycan/xylan/chitin deacetylase (PgdA/CDA1 family)
MAGVKRKWGLRALISAAMLAVGLMVFPRTLPAILSRYRPDIRFHYDGSEPVLYLTIDDAPSAATSQIVAVLAKHGVPATFFIIGNRVSSNDQIRAIRDAGCGVGHHMKTTERCSVMPLERFRNEFDETHHLLNAICPVGYFRPPSDLGTREQMQFVVSRGYQPIVGSIFPLDHWVRQPWILRALVRWMAVPGGIIIMHDGTNRGSTTAAVLDVVLPELKRAGYRFQALPPLKARDGPAPLTPAAQQTPP